MDQEAASTTSPCRRARNLLTIRDMRAIWLVVAACTALASAGPATAATGQRPAGISNQPITEEAKLNAYLNVARSYWPESRCAGRETGDIGADAALDTFAGPDAMGLALIGECRILLRSGMPPTEFCITLAHELGHLAGHGHETYGVMRPEGEETGPCVKAARHLEFTHQWQQAVAELPGAGRKWRITRRPGRRYDGATVFVAKRAGMKARSIRELPPTGDEPRFVMGPSIINPGAG